LPQIQLIPSDFKSGITPSGFLWDGEDMGGVPFISTPDGAIFEPLLRFFAHGWKHRVFRSKSSMMPVMYSVREWLCYLANNDFNWKRASDKCLRSFRLFLRKRAEVGDFTEYQVALKLRHVFEFYAGIPNAMPFVARNCPTKVFVGLEGLGAPITAKQKKSRRGKKSDRLRWSGADIVVVASQKRPTPGYNDVKRILEYLRTKSLGDNEGSWAGQLRVCEGERNWLLARCEAEAGLRRKETAQLSLRELAKALAKHRIISLPKTTISGRNPLSLAIHDEVARKEILDKINVHKNRGYETFDVIVKKKGVGTRSVEMPIDLMVDILNIGVWGIKKILESNWSGRGFDIDQDALFYSSTGSGRRLSVGSVGDIVGDAFKELDIAGSGHRLRAYYLTNMAWLLWNQFSALNGYRNDVIVENQTLNRLADLAGHKEPGTTERHYLDMARMIHDSKQNKPRVKAASEAMNALRRVSPILPSNDLRRIESVIVGLEDLDNLMFRAGLDALVDRYATSKILPKQTISHIRAV
jgi:hypothetical protein